MIDHPLDNNKKLQYASLEGPEHAVFLRGKTNENIINLPNYWSALVDENTISVNLTPINVYSNIYVVDYNNSRVTTNGNNGNYLLLDLKTAEKAKNFVAFLKNKEIYVKGPWSGSRDKYITITIGPAELMERFVNATKEFLAK